jgi:hypothetical protein
LINYRKSRHNQAKQVLDGCVDVTFGLALIGIFSVAQICVVLAAAWAGITLREVHQEAASTCLFIFARRYGLWKTSIGFIRLVWNRRIFRWSRYSRNMQLIAISAILIVGLWGAVGLLIPYVILGLLPRSQDSSLGGEILRRTGEIGAVLTAVLGAGLWLRGVNYLARPQVRRISRLPRLSSHDLSLNVRNNLALNIFWYSRIRWAGVLAAAYPWLFLTVAAYSGNLAAERRQAATQPASPQDTIIVLLITLSTIIVPVAMVHVIRRRIVAWKVSAELYLILHPRKGPKDGSRNPTFSFPIVDPLGNQRNQLARIALDLSSAAKTLERRQAKTLGPHPISTILRAVSNRSGSPGESHPRAPTESVRNSLPLHGSCRPGHPVSGFSQAQCAK